MSAKKDIWFTERELQDHVKSIGHPAYDNESQSAKGKSKFFDELSKSSDVINDVKSPEDK